MRRRRGRPARMRGPRILGLVLGSVAFSALLFLFVLPGRTYLTQQHSLTAAGTQVRVLADENTRLAQAVTRLQTDAEIERLARQRYGLVKPGEQAFAIVPAKPPSAPAQPAKRPSRGLLGRLWQDVKFWS